MEKSKLQVEITSERQSILRVFYIGSLSTITLLSVFLLTLYIASVDRGHENALRSLENALLNEKKRFLRNEVERTISMIELESKMVKAKYANKGLAKKKIDAIAKKKITSLIRNIKLIDNGYIWVNRIVNYQGGDQYAIRQIHPNLPETEGQWLSTNMTDIKGNRPYEIELNGINKNGDVFFKYYFKKIELQEIAHRMSFSKLYKPYDWLVATGVYRDDIDFLLEQEKNRMQKSHDTLVYITIFVAVLIFSFGVITIKFFERRIAQIILAYEDKIEKYTAELEKKSTTDSLTCVANRLKLDQILNENILFYQRYHKDFSILLLDLDKFKNINDTFGHLVGDQVLVEFAALMAEDFRKTDSIGRWGGEEFLIVLPKIRLEEAKLIAQKLCEKVQKHPFTSIYTLTCSIGVTQVQQGDTLKSIIKRADHALYIAKNTGRNRVESS